jgi:hypothetical protein
VIQEQDQVKIQHQQGGFLISISIIIGTMDELIGMATDFITEKVLHMKKPEADLTDVQVKHLDRNALQLESNVAISNPYSHDLPIFELTYQIKSGGRYTSKHTYTFFHTHTDRYAYIHTYSLASWA